VVKEFVNPNYHVVLIHAPLGLLFAGVLVELFSFLGWRRGGFRAAGRWMILLGTLTAIPAALSGVYALHDVTVIGLSETDASMHWKDVTARSPLVQDAEAWDHLSDHALVQSAATGVLVLVVLIFLGCSDKWRARLYWPLLILLLLGVSMTAAGAWHAGEAVYTHGVGVERGSRHEMSSVASNAITAAARQTTEATPTTSPTTATEPAATAPQATAPPVTAPAKTNGQATEHTDRATTDRTGADRAWRNGGGTDESATGSEQRSAKRGIEYFLPPVQVHVILAGFAIAIAVAALGLAFRQANVDVSSAESIDGIAAALGPRAEDDPYLPAEQRRAMADASAAVARRYGVPPARFWLLGSLLILCTAGVGIYLLGGPHGIDNFDPKAMWEEISNPQKNDGSRFPVTRQMAHVIGGSAIFVLMFLLAILGRWAPRQRVLLTLLALVLIAVVAAQVWLGILLMYDTSSGPMTAFN
jgi:uncharacterized membrane protein